MIAPSVHFSTWVTLVWPKPSQNQPKTPRYDDKTDSKKKKKSSTEISIPALVKKKMDFCAAGNGVPAGCIKKKIYFNVFKNDHKHIDTQNQRRKTENEMDPDTGTVRKERKEEQKSVGVCVAPSLSCRMERLKKTGSKSKNKHQRIVTHCSMMSSVQELTLRSPVFLSLTHQHTNTPTHYMKQRNERKKQHTGDLRAILNKDTNRIMACNPWCLSPATLTAAPYGTLTVGVGMGMGVGVGEGVGVGVGVTVDPINIVFLRTRGCGVGVVSV